MPNKNVVLLNSDPLIAYTIKAGLASKLDQVIVSTDNSQIAKISRSYGVKVITRPNELALDDTPTLPVLQHALSTLPEKYDVVMTLQPTSPLRTKDNINDCIEIFNNNLDADSLVSVVEIPHSYMPDKIMMFDGCYLKGSTEAKRRQDMSKIYARNGAAIYMTRTENLKDFIFGGKILPYFMSKLNSFEIDDLEDLEIMKKLI